MLGGEAVLHGQHDGRELGGGAEAERVEGRLREGAEAVAAAVEVHQHRELDAAGHRRRRRPVDADAKAVRRVVHHVLPFHAGDVRERLLWSEDGLVAADDGAVAEELDDAEEILHDVRCRVAGHGVSVIRNYGYGRWLPPRSLRFMDVEAGVYL